MGTGQIDCTPIDLESPPNVKPGIKLPKSDLDWQSANIDFAAAMPISGIDTSNIEDTLNAMYSVIYDYFRDNFGTLEMEKLRIFPLSLAIFRLQHVQPNALKQNYLTWLALY